MRKLKKQWWTATIAGVILLFFMVIPVRAQLNSFLVQTQDGLYYVYNSDDLNNSYLSEQTTPGSQAGIMYRHFNGLLSEGGWVCTLRY